MIFTENEVDMTVTLEAAFDTGQPVESSPAHKLAMYIADNYETLLRAANGTTRNGNIDSGIERDCAELGADDREDGPKIEIIQP